MGFFYQFYHPKNVNGAEELHSEVLYLWLRIWTVYVMTDVSLMIPSVSSSFKFSWFWCCTSWDNFSPHTPISCHSFIFFPHLRTLISKLVEMLHSLWICTCIDGEREKLRSLGFKNTFHIIRNRECFWNGGGNHLFSIRSILL